RSYSCLSRPQALHSRQILLTRKVSCRHVCSFVSRQLSSIRSTALAKNQRALKPSAALSFAQIQTKSEISSDVVALGSNSITAGNWVIADQNRRKRAYGSLLLLWAIWRVQLVHRAACRISP